MRKSSQKSSIHHFDIRSATQIYKLPFNKSKSPEKSLKPINHDYATHHKRKDTRTNQLFKEIGLELSNDFVDSLVNMSLKTKPKPARHQAKHDLEQIEIKTGLKQRKKSKRKQSK